MRRFQRPAMALSLLVLLLIAGLAGVSRLKFSSFLSESVNRRLEIVVTTSARDFSAATDLGLSLEEIANGPAILDRGREHDPNITAAYVVDLNGDVVHAAGSPPQVVDRATLESFDLALRGVTGPDWNTESDEVIRSGSLIRGSFGQAVGGIVVEYPTTEMRAKAGSMSTQLALNGLVVAAGVIALGALAFGLFRSRLVGAAMNESTDGPTVDTPDALSSIERSSRLLALAVSALLIVGVAVFGALIVREFNDALAPELERRAALIGETIVDDTGRATDLGIPLDELVGVEEYFAVFLNEFPELDFLAIQGVTGGEMHAASSVGATNLVANSDSTVFSFDLVDSSSGAGAVVVGVDSGFVTSRLRDLALDVVVILIVALVVAFEATLVLSRRIATSGAEPRSLDRASWAAANATTNVRLVLFIFVVAEELNKSFLPLLIQSAHNPIGALDTKIAVSLPIVAYLLTIALASPLAGRLNDRFGNRAVFLAGVVPAAASHFGMVFADNVFEIVGLRALTGIGYAIVTVSATDYILDRISSEGRAKAIGVFVAVVIGGTFSGTALGGILADRLGFDDVFIISFVLVVLAGLIGSRVMKMDQGSDVVRSDSFELSEVLVVLRNRSLMRLLAGVSIPMNVLMAAFLWYLVPLAMADLGSSPSTIARTLMIYYLMILLGGPFATKMARGHVGNSVLVGVGSVASGAVLVVPAFSFTEVAIGLAVLVVGISHAAIRGPQMVLALDIADDEFPDGGRGPILAAMRSLERLGSLVGLLAVAALASVFSLAAAIGMVGVMVGVAGLIYVAAGSRVRPMSLTRV